MERAEEQFAVEEGWVEAEEKQNELLVDSEQEEADVGANMSPPRVSADNQFEDDVFNFNQSIQITVIVLTSARIRTC